MMLKKTHVQKIVMMAAIVLGAGTSWLWAAHSDEFGCDACHVPHNAQALPGVPLWNGSATTTTFTMYSSATFKAQTDGQPSGPSKLCLSCHDGANPNYLWMSDDIKFGADALANSHPISFVYDSSLATADGALKDPSEDSTLGGTITEDLLDPDSKVQCTSCHDIHTSGVGQHLLRGYDYGNETLTAPDGSTRTVHHGSELCRMCHLK